MLFSKIHETSKKTVFFYSAYDNKCCDLNMDGKNNRSANAE